MEKPKIQEKLTVKALTFLAKHISLTELEAVKAFIAKLTSKDEERIS